MNNQQKQFTEKTAPEGYWTDAKDAFIPVKLLKPIDWLVTLLSVRLSPRQLN